ncbi:hypothetical protein IEQ34_016015 [Dendrobium chrysotoxum]|uniref:Ribosomal protein S14 n=1 Tax=Dendrobium chrysotoxum TaxID=161865 RepID=A0AAV7GCB3_DENCH|nr:hypothetical protein IEQ34_016015 [Dendrobium chrysotoxum]
MVKNVAVPARSSVVKVVPRSESLKRRPNQEDATAAFRLWRREGGGCMVGRLPVSRGNGRRAFVKEGRDLWGGLAIRHWGF